MSYRSAQPPPRPRRHRLRRDRLPLQDLQRRRPDSVMRGARRGREARGAAPRNLRRRPGGSTLRSSAIALDDLLRDGESEADVFAPRVDRPVGKEPVEDALQVGIGDPGPASSIVTTASAGVLRDRDGNRGPAGEKPIALARRFSKTCDRRSGDASTLAARPSITSSIRTPSGHGRVERLDELPDQRAQVDRFRHVGFDLSLDARDVAKARNQALEPGHVPNHQIPKPLALFRRVGIGHHFRRGANGGERILQLVRHVGGKRLEQLDVIVRPPCQLAERARERADLVLSRRAGKEPGRGPRRSASADAWRRRRVSGLTIVIAASAVSSAAAASRRHHDLEDAQADVVQGEKDPQRGL